MATCPACINSTIEYLGEEEDIVPKRLEKVVFATCGWKANLSDEELLEKLPTLI